MQVFHVLFVCTALLSAINCASFSNTAGNINGLLNAYPMSRLNPFLRNSACPLCDSSVYSYCSHKMFHDACCCGSPYGGGGGLGGYQCQFSNCQSLYANTCYEHNLITNCCCNSEYR